MNGFKYIDKQYDELRAQLGADADLTAPSFTASTPFAGMRTRVSNAGLREPNRIASAGPTLSSSSNANKDGVNEQQMSNAFHQTSAIACAADPVPAAATDRRISVSTGVAGITTGYGTQPGYVLP